MKIFRLVLFFSFCCFGAFAQINEYKKVLASKRSSSAEAYYKSLKDFQKNNSQFSNVYFQLGETELEFFREFDPIVNRNGSRHYIYNAKINYGLSKGFLNTKEAIKYPAFYNIASSNKDSLVALIQAKVDKKYETVVLYSEAYERLLIHYDKAVDFYLKAQQKFIDINTSSENLRALFLTANNTLRQNIKEVGQDFDSCIYHLERYKSAYQELPHKKKRKVKLNLQKIHHFRMNGITPSNFLADEIDLWDYHEWSQNFSRLLNDEVDGLREEIEQAYVSYLEINEKMMFGEECLQTNVDNLKFQRIINLITKYDSESILIDVFSYLDSKLKFGNQLVYEKNCNVIESLPTSSLLSRKVRTFKNLHAEVDKVDSVAQAVANTSGTTTNFKWFYNEYMPGEGGYLKFSNDQIKENNEGFKSELNYFMSLINNQYLTSDSINICYLQKDSLLIADSKSTEGKTSCILKKLSVSDSLDITLISVDNAFLVTGLKRIGSNYKMLWKFQAPSPIEFFKVLTDSTFIYGGNTEQLWLNHISSSGVQIASISIKETDSIQDVYYNELIGVYSIVTGYEQSASGGGYSYHTVGSNGKLKSSEILPIEGTFANLFINDQNNWVFSESEGDSGTVVFATVFDGSLKEVGEAIKYSFSNNIIFPRVIKNDNKDITIIGNDKNNELGIIYALIDYEGNIKYETNFK